MSVKRELLDLIKQIHFSCYKLCHNSFGRYFDNAGNLGVFSQDDDQYQKLTKIREEITEPSNNPDQKYFTLRNPIIISAEDVPETAYYYLYIRKPDPTSYGKYIGDVDFFVEPEEYERIKIDVISGKIKGAQIYDRPGWDMIQLSNPEINAVAYIGKKDATEKVRVKQSE